MSAAAVTPRQFDGFHRPATHDGVITLTQDVDESIIEFQDQLDPRILCKKAEQCCPRCSIPKLTGAEMRSGPVRRVGGEGPAGILLHGFGDTGDM
jgi:hypothetical protein